MRFRRIFILGLRPRTASLTLGVQNAFGVLSNLGPFTVLARATKKEPTRGSFLMAEGERLKSNALWRR